MGADVVPPLPEGFKIDSVPGLPAGFSLDKPIDTTAEVIPDFKSRALQSLPRSLAFGPGFKSAQGGSANDLEKGAIEAGNRVTDATGSPLLGTTARMVPEVLPLLGGLGSAATLAPKIESGAKTLMQSAIKPTPADLLSGKAQRATQFMLENEGMSPTPEGAQNLRKLGESLNEEVTNLIKEAGGTVDKGKIGSRISDVISRIESSNPTPNKARDAAENVYNEFMRNSILPKDIPVEQAQKMKQGLYKILKDQYGKLELAGTSEGTAAETASKKALASGFRQALEDAIPSVKYPNAKASEVWNALNVSERRALMEANKDPIGMAFIPHDPLKALGFWANRNSAFKSALAKILYNNSEALGSVPGVAAGAAIDASHLNP